MKLRVKSNGREIELSGEQYQALPANQKMNYVILDKSDSPEVKASAEVAKPQRVKNKKAEPPTGQKENTEG